MASRLSKDSFQRSVVKEKIDKLQASIEGEAAENLKKNALKSFFKNGKDQTYQKAVLFSERQNVKLPPAVAALLIKKVEESLIKFLMWGGGIIRNLEFLVLV